MTTAPLPFVGYQYWDQQRIGIVINKEALSVDRANFLATHVPMRRIAYERAPRQIPTTSESGLLDELNHHAAADQHVFAVIKGIPGTGKSHLIRWLKEQYALAHPDDAVLLIARANTSLRSTIEQIIAARVFDVETLPDSFKRLKDAVDVLSRDTLADDILDALRRAAKTLDHAQVEQQLGELHRRLSPDKIEKFLLDIQVRSRLAEAGGPIERVVTFLTAGTGSSQGPERLPSFAADDFLFGIDRLRQMRNRGGYSEVLNLCEDLQKKEEIRESLARYLSFALHRFAIGHATQLAAGDLRSMFADLRRHLRREGRSLALFIEDITAFTGIDQGLVEVLVTQHRGEANAEFCRLHAVVGITDAWYADYLPDNIKERVTHRLTLNTHAGRAESDLLQDENVLTEFAARYMNAMRVSQAELDTWAERGAQPDALPNACAGCLVREACHAAFGTVARDGSVAGAAEGAIGLYPFNRQALASLYKYLRDDISRTPRSLLNSILAYILQSHGDKVAAGEFPPPPTELATDVAVPTFNPPAHERIIDTQGGPDARRLRTLFLYWGSRNVYAGGDVNAAALVGGLPPAVLRAFRLPAISGAQTQGAPAAPASPVAPAISEQPAATVALPKPAAVNEEAPSTTAITPPKPPQWVETVVESPTSRLTHNINDWANGGKLFAFDRFADWLAAVIRSFIDWQAHGISTNQVREYVTGSRLYIEGQSGAQLPGRLYLHLKRSDPDLRYVLQALADLNEAGSKPSPAQYGEHIATLSHWLRGQEARIVRFVREPSELPVAPDYLAGILLENCTLFACLAGELTAAAAGDPLQLYQQVIATCAVSTEGRWGETRARLKDGYPNEWVLLMRKVDVGGAVHRCRTELLQLLNRPQGASPNVRFLDAATALTLLQKFTRRHWQPSSLPFKPDTTDPLWTSAIAAHEALEGSGAAAWQAAQTALKSEQADLSAYLEANATPETLLAAIKLTLDDLRQVQSFPEEMAAPFGRGYSGRITAPALAELLRALDQQLRLPPGCGQIAGLAAGYGAWQAASRDFLGYLGLVGRKLGEQKTKFARDIEELRCRSDAEQRYTAAVEEYDRLLSLLATYAPEKEDA